MFRRLPRSLPEDPHYPADLEQLGYFINENSQIRKIEAPKERFQFKITDNERINEVQREAMHECIRKEIKQRMIDLNIPPLYLPQLSRIRPQAPHVPIFATPQHMLKAKKRVLVIVNDHTQDLGVWAYRIISGDGGIEAGSCVSLVQDSKCRSSAESEEPGVIILNPGQLLYSHKQNRAMSNESWCALPRESAVHPPTRIHPVQNYVEGNRTVEEHIDYVFSHILKDVEWVSPDAEIYLVGILESGNLMLKYLDKNWTTWCSRIEAIGLIKPSYKHGDFAPIFETFLEERARAWVLSTSPADICIAIPSSESTPIPATDGVGQHWQDDTLCPTFSGGVDGITECIFPTVYTHVISFFEEVADSLFDYRNPDFEVYKSEEEAVEAGSSEESGVDEEKTDEHEIGFLNLDKGKQRAKIEEDEANADDLVKKIENVKLGESSSPMRNNGASSDKVLVAGLDVDEELLRKADLFG